MIRTLALRYQYPGAPTLDFGDVEVAQGGVLLLRGSSGSGKSTWLALVAGLLTPTAGEAVVAGQPLSQLRPAARDAWRARSLGFLPQKLHLSEALTVEGNLALAYYAAGLPADHQAMLRTLQALGIAELAARRPSQLSGGQAQRAALARSILLAPQVILADEPTASLDDEAAAASLQLLRDAAASCHATLVIATHDARVAAGFPQASVHPLAALPAAPVAA